MTWQDISTAPRDGSRVLLYGSYVYPGDTAPTEYTMIGAWEERAFADGVRTGWVTDEGMHMSGFFSHWQPLPSPPKGPTMNDWYLTAKAIIAGVHEGLPHDADLTTRRQACIRAKPSEFASTSWGKKTWARAQREYLVKFGYVPRTAAGKAGIPLLSPLEKAKQRATRPNPLR